MAVGHKGGGPRKLRRGALGPTAARTKLIAALIILTKISIVIEFPNLVNDHGVHEQQLPADIIVHTVMSHSHWLKKLGTHLVPSLVEADII